MANRSPAAWLPRLYVAVALFAVVPIWSVKYLPTVDGPSHVYNAWILRELIRGARGPVAQWFAIDWRPYPNWIGHAAMALLMTFASPTAAEKLFVSGIVLLFLYAMWCYAGAADEENRVFAFLAVPFAYNLMLQNGFYNFCAGAALYFLIVAVWWRRRDRPDARTIAIVATLLLLCYFAHAMPAVLGVGSIALLWLATLPGRRLRVHARHLIALVPIAPLLIWFAPVGSAYLRGWTKRGELLAAIAQMRILYSFDERQLVLGGFIAAILGALVIVTLARRQWSWSERDAFILLWLAIVAVYALSEYAVADVQDRVALFVALTPLAWVSPRLPPRVGRSLAIGLAALALANSVYILDRYREVGGYIDQFVRSADALGRRATFMPVLSETTPPDTFVPAYYHAIDYAAVKKESVDISNYEPALGYFPIAFRPGFEAADPDPGTLDVASIALRAQYVFTWRIDGDPKLSVKLAPYYTRVGGRGSGAVFRATISTADAERVLLPLMGSTSDRGAPAGMSWRVEQRVQNRGPTAVTLLLSACDGQSCMIDLKPGDSAPLAAEAPFGFAYVPRKQIDGVQFTTILRRVDPWGNGAAVEVPAVRERDFGTGSVVIAGVPLRDPLRVALRVWTLGESPNAARVTLRDAAGRAIAERALPLDAHGAGSWTDLVHEFSGAQPRAEPVSVEVDAGRAEVWALVSAVDPHVPAPTLYVPRVNARSSAPAPATARASRP